MDPSWCKNHRFWFRVYIWTQSQTMKTVFAVFILKSRSLQKSATWSAAAWRILRSFFKWFMCSPNAKIVGIESHFDVTWKAFDNITKKKDEESGRKRAALRHSTSDCVEFWYGALMTHTRSSLIEFTRKNRIFDKI